ncbi:MAG: hypothetical protein QOH12_3855 [Solirubrobacteraceae bacterium]|jgi:hypothetical protein|nr:hypothetical protein [Solirubrobacteraceae bacterium]
MRGLPRSSVSPSSRCSTSPRPASSAGSPNGRAAPPSARHRPGRLLPRPPECRACPECLACPGWRRVCRPAPCRTSVRSDPPARRSPANRRHPSRRRSSSRRRGVSPVRRPAFRGPVRALWRRRRCPVAKQPRRWGPSRLRRPASHRPHAPRVRVRPATRRRRAVPRPRRRAIRRCPAPRRHRRPAIPRPGPRHIRRPRRSDPRRPESRLRPCRSASERVAPSRSPALSRPRVRQPMAHLGVLPLPRLRPDGRPVGRMPAAPRAAARVRRPGAPSLSSRGPS